MFNSSQLQDVLKCLQRCGHMLQGDVPLNTFSYSQGAKEVRKNPRYFFPFNQNSTQACHMQSWMSEQYYIMPSYIANHMLAQINNYMLSHIDS